MSLQVAGVRICGPPAHRYALYNTSEAVSKPLRRCVWCFRQITCSHCRLSGNNPELDPSPHITAHVWFHNDGIGRSALKRAKSRQEQSNVMNVYNIPGFLPLLLLCNDNPPSRSHLFLFAGLTERQEKVNRRIFQLCKCD
jgi:hypothetical protein